MLSLIRIAALAGILSVGVQGAVVLDRWQLRESGPVAHTCACIDIAPVASATDSHPLPTVHIGAPIGTTGSPRTVYLTEGTEVFSQPLFTRVPTGTSSVESGPSIGGSYTVVEASSAGEAGWTFTPGASATSVHFMKSIFTRLIPSQETTLEEVSVSRTASTVATADTQANTPRS
ncbi:hypothetical protein IW261DRAFT_1506082 [Armillaria novae-zelandiae]|uniref:Uncharacterized protein n=1 Tax=Armillaria novae-zelandiae TaxID=153914 RepID=A0AA39U2K2_9AGAR|nr:hypothetical protein IW261DRAFT_1506082 [Armillaria novae-zelandiae]